MLETIINESIIRIIPKCLWYNLRITFILKPPDARVFYLKGREKAERIVDEGIICDYLVLI